MGYRWVENRLNRLSRVKKGLKRKCSRVKKVFQCTHTMGVSEPSLHKESTDSLIGIAQVTRHQPCTFENLIFHFHYAFHFTLEEISVKNR